MNFVKKIADIYRESPLSLTGKAHHKDLYKD
jgi:hypothetical protein